ncbi:hypothetical protein [Actinopolyspora lacussalsi]|uniref:hypothetical protein n=1 Tax=Actinopolyspora righensis TaxID=995060 RepID=UPI0011138A3B|nr:hypothetical protein [Actinopolyspora righensis]
MEHEIEGGDVLRGKIFTHENIDHLVLTKGRDDVPRQQHLSTGEVAEVPVDVEEWQVIESSFVSFLDFGNVFGFMRSAGTSPSPQAVAKWINESGVFEEKLIAEPVIDREKWERVRKAGGVSRLEIAGPTSLAPRLSGGPVEQLAALGGVGEFRFEIKLTAERSKKRSREERNKLLRMVDFLCQNVGLGELEKAKAQVFDEEGNNSEDGAVDLLKQRFSQQCSVDVTGSGSVRSITELSAFDAIMTVSKEFREDLASSVGAEFLP